MEAIVKELLAANLRLTEQYTELAKAVIETRTGPVALPLGPRVPSFEEFAHTRDLTDTEKLFYTEEEEDEKFHDDLFGGTKQDPALVKEILAHAGIDPSTTTV